MQPVCMVRWDFSMGKTKRNVDRSIVECQAGFKKKKDVNILSTHCPNNIIKRKNLIMALSCGCQCCVSFPDYRLSITQTSLPKGKIRQLPPLLMGKTIHQLEMVANIFSKSHELLLDMKIKRQKCYIDFAVFLLFSLHSFEFI